MMIHSKAYDTETQLHSDYSSKSYWEQRYNSIQQEQLNQPIDDDSRSHADSTCESKSLYEWYVSLDHIFPLLEEDIRRCGTIATSTSASALPGGDSSVTIFVSGCGNSLLCEELWKRSK